MTSRTICRATIENDGKLTEYSYEYRPKYADQYVMEAMKRRWPKITENPLRAQYWTAWKLIKEAGGFDGQFDSFLDSLVSYTEEQTDDDTPLTQVNL